jgi:hypothetical protein
MIKIYVSDKDFEEIADRNLLNKDVDTLRFNKYDICFKRNKYVRIKLPGDFIVNAEYEEMEKSKMTREEALERTGFIKDNKNIVSALEALGLLKFEEEPSIVSSPRPVPVEDRIRDTKEACLSFFVAVERGFGLDYYIKQLKNCVAEW